MSTVVRSKRTSQCRDVLFETKIMLSNMAKQAVAAAAVRLSGLAPAGELLGPPSGRRGEATEGGAGLSVVDDKRSAAFASEAASRCLK